MGLFSRKPEPATITRDEFEASMRSIADSLNVLKLMGYDTTPNGLGDSTITEKKALTLSALWRCVRLISDTFASLPFHVYRETNNGSEYVSGHQVATLIRTKPSTGMTSFVWRSMAMSRLLLHGNFYALIVRDRRGTVIELKPIDSKVEAVFEEGELFYKFELNDITKVEPERNILHLKGYTSDGITGMSVLSAHRESFGIGLGAQKASKEFYDKGAKIDGYLSTDQALKPDTVKRVEDTFQKNIDGGVRVPLLDAGLKLHSFKLAPQDAQYIETRKFTETDIARIFGVPPHMIGVMDRATWNNVELLGIEFSKYTMLPHCTNWEQEINTKLLRPSEQGTHYTRFNMDGIMRADLITRYNSYKVGIAYGILSVNEARAYEDMNPIDGGDKHYVQTNNMQDITASEDGQ